MHCYNLDCSGYIYLHALVSGYALLFQLSVWKLCRIWFHLQLVDYFSLLLARID
jgi:hypothetical protein